MDEKMEKHPYHTHKLIRIPETKKKIDKNENLRGNEKKSVKTTKTQKTTPRARNRFFRKTRINIGSKIEEKGDEEFQLIG